MNKLFVNKTTRKNPTNIILSEKKIDTKDFMLCGFISVKSERGGTNLGVGSQNVVDFAERMVALTRRGRGVSETPGGGTVLTTVVISWVCSPGENSLNSTQRTHDFLCLSIFLFVSFAL